MRYQKGTFVQVPNKHILLGMPAIVQAVYIWVCAHADEDGVCFPSKATIAQEAGCSVRAADNAIEELCVKGLLEKSVRHDPKNPDRNLANLYQITLIENTVVGQEVRGGTAGGAGGVPQEVRTNYIHRTISKEEGGESENASPIIEVPDKPQKPKPTKRDTTAMDLRDWAYAKIGKEWGVMPTYNMGDYARIVAALKVLKEKDIKNIIEDALDEGKKRTVREMLTDRAIDIYRQEHS